MKGFKRASFSGAVALFAVAFLSDETVADQPVHCLRTQVEGIWEFAISNDKPTYNLYEVESVCTHLLPNMVQIVNTEMSFDLGQTTILRVMLNQDYTGEVLDANDVPTGERIDWNMIYDQSLYVTLPESQRQIFANFRYSVDPRIAERDWHLLQSGTYEAFISRCSETMVGFLMADGVSDQIQCTVGYQVAPTLGPEEQSLFVETDTYAQNVEVSFAQTGSSTQSSAQADTKAAESTEDEEKVGTPTDDYHEVPEDERQRVADLVNASDLTYTAKAYTDADLKRPTGGSGETILAQTGARGQYFGEETQRFYDAFDYARMYLQQPLEEIDAEELPSDFRWDDIDGYDFTNPHADQGRCGSCYKLSVNGVLESRIKLWFGQDYRLSVQHRLDCDFMNEGCHGGWGFTDAIFMKNFYAVDESCAPYTGNRSPDGCATHTHCKNSARAKVKDAYYLGGHYGSMSEEMILKELRANGPILMDFNADQRFQTYHNGILSDDQIVQMDTVELQEPATTIMAQIGSGSTVTSTIEATGGISMETQLEKGLQWVKLTHSVMLIGWGYDTQLQTKYWILRNSYGPYWGEDGNFRIRRGNNDFGCEGNNITILPQIMDSATGQWLDLIMQ